MSSEIMDKISAMVNIGDKDPAFVLWAGSVEAANKWASLIHFLAEEANENAETGYDTDPLIDELDLLCWQTFNTLKNMGIDLPKMFPNELDINYEEYSDDLWDLIHGNPYSSLIYRIYTSLTNVYGFYVAYVSDLVLDDELDLMGTLS